MRPSLPLLCLALTGALLSTASPARAQSLRDPAWESLLENERFAQTRDTARGFGERCLHGCPSGRPDECDVVSDG